MIKLKLLILVSCLLPQVGFSQTEQIDTAKIHREMDQGDFKSIHAYINANKKEQSTRNLNIAKQFSSPTEGWDKRIRSVRYARNIALQSLYVENSAPSNFMYARMDVRDTSSNVFDALINMNFYMLPKYWPIGLVVNPRFNLRMFLDEDSAPIRTPSNMVGGTLFRFLTSEYNPSGMYAFTTFSFYHHSNGQAIGSYNGDGTINTKTGNFGVNFMEISTLFGKSNSNKGTNWYFKTGFQQDYILGQREVETGKKDLENEYGVYRLNFEGSFTKYNRRTDTKALSLLESPFRVSRIMLRGSVVRAPSKDLLLNIEAQYYWKLPFAPNFFLTGAAGWLGHDYYNIYFNEQTAFLRVGLAATVIAGAGPKLSDITSKYLH